MGTRATKSKKEHCFSAGELQRLFEDGEREFDAAQSHGSHDPRHNIAAIEALFSGARASLLAFLFGQPDRRFGLRELIRLTRGGCGSVSREVARLEACGLLVSRTEGGHRFLQANSVHPLYPELRSIFGKTTGLATPIRRSLEVVEQELAGAFVFTGLHSCEPGLPHLQLAVLAERWPSHLGASLRAAERSLGRRITATVLGLPVCRGWFVDRILECERFWVLGGEELLAGTITNGP